MRIIDYKPEHAHEILAGPLNEGVPETTYQFGYTADKIGIEGQTFTGVVNGYVVACGGIIPLWPGVGEGWVLASYRIHHNRFSVVRSVCVILDNLMEDHGYWRIQGATLANWKQGIRFANLLGFEKEGVMRRYGPDGSDYIRHAKVKDGY